MTQSQFFVIKFSFFIFIPPEAVIVILWEEGKRPPNTFTKGEDTNAVVP